MMKSRISWNNLMLKGNSPVNILKLAYLVFHTQANATFRCIFWYSVNNLELTKV